MYLYFPGGRETVFGFRYNILSVLWVPSDNEYLSLSYS